MSERAPIRSPLVAVTLSAVVGTMLGYVFWTPEGRHLHRRLDGWLDEMIDELRHLQDTSVKVRTTIDEGRRAFRSIEHDDRQPA